MRYKKFMPIAVREKKESPTAQKILTTAYDVFLELGYHATTLRTIAKRADINVSLIPYHFESKENLAKRVNMRLTENLYCEIVRLESVKNLSSAERIYVSSALYWERMCGNPAYFRFFRELMESVGTTDLSSPAFVKMTEDIIRDYRLPITPTENEVYLTALKGTEQLLLYRFLKEDLVIPFSEINDISISHYFFDIGLPDQEIAQILSHCHQICVGYGLWR